MGLTVFFHLSPQLVVVTVVVLALHKEILAGLLAAQHTTQQLLLGQPAKAMRAEWTRLLPLVAVGVVVLEAPEVTLLP